MSAFTITYTDPFGPEITVRRDTRAEADELYTAALRAHPRAKIELRHDAVILASVGPRWEFNR